MSAPSADDVARYRAYWETLSPASTGDLRHLAVPAMRFTDPFNAIVGVDRIVAMLDHMLSSLNAPRFEVRRAAVGDDCAFYAWRFEARFRGRAIEIEGVSEVTFDAEGRVTLHRDHFDAAMQVYARLPLLGGLLRIARGRFAFPG
jgi:steroid delta-isomerase